MKIVNLLLPVFIIFAIAHNVPASTSSDEFVHGTYVMSRKLTPKIIEEGNWEQFDFVYAVSGPSWKDNDFIERKESLRKYVDEHSYSVLKNGERLTPMLIKKVHSTGGKILVSLTTELGRGNFSAMACSVEKRKIFSETMALFCQKYGFDGIDVDWESNIIVHDYIDLLKSLRSALNGLNDSKKYYLVTALGTYWKFSSDQVKDICDSVDWINIMSYDLTNGDSKNNGHHTPLDFIKLSMELNWERFPRNKICLGLANYGYKYVHMIPEKVYRNKNAIRSYFPYKELPELLEEGWIEAWSSRQEVPYYYSPDRRDFIVIDNGRSHAAKVSFALQKKYKGLFWWEFNYDYVPPKTGERHGVHLLIDKVSDCLRTYGK